MNKRELERKYWYPEQARPMNWDDVASADEETQKVIMREWFFSHFENPVENTPFESKEGGYIYIWGGPYNAREELISEFEEIVSDDVINELVAELEQECVEWTGKTGAEEFDRYIYEVVASNTQFYETFLNSVDKIKALMKLNIDEALRRNYYMLLYVNLITGLETYLSDAFINTVLNNERLIQKFVETNLDFAKQKFSLNEIFLKMEHLETEVKTYLIDMIWHNLEKAKHMYKKTLDVDFPQDIKDIFKAIVKRHDIVHRNGRTKEGVEIQVNKDDIIELIDKTSSFVDYIDKQVTREKI